MKMHAIRAFSTLKLCVLGFNNVDCQLHNIHMHQIITLYISNVHNNIGQSYLNKAGEI